VRPIAATSPVSRHTAEESLAFSPERGLVRVHQRQHSLEDPHAPQVGVGGEVRAVDAAAKRAGLRAGVSPHWLRHAHATHALERGAPIHLVQATLGHASVVTTGRYLHARPSDSSARYLAV
jgi:integrase